MIGMRSIRSRTFALFVVPSFVLVALGAMLGYQRVAQRTIASATAEATAAAAATASDFSARLGRLAQQATATANHISLSDQLPSDAELFDILESNVRTDSLVYGSAFGFSPRVLHDRDRFAPYVFAAPDGIRRIDIGAVSYDYTLPEWEWFASPAADGAPLWTAPYFDTDAGGIIMVTYSAPLQIEGGFGGVATVDVALSELPTQLSVDLPTNLRLLLVDGAADVVWDSQTTPTANAVRIEDLSAPETPSAWIEQVLAPSPGALELPPGALGAERQTALFAPVADTPWQLVAVLDRGAILSEVRREAVAWTGGGFVAFLALGLVAWRASASSTRRMHELARHASALSAGNYGMRVDESDDELGDVARALNHLGAELADRQAAAVAAQQRRFGDLVDTSPRGTLLVDPARKVVYANAAAMTLLAPSGRTLEGRPLASMLAVGSDVDAVWTNRRGEQATLGQIDLLGETGETITVDASLAAIGESDADGLTVLSFRDVREDLRAARILAERERFLAGIFQNAGVGIVVTDPDGTIRDANVTFREYVGRDLLGLLGHPFAELLHEEEREDGGRILAALGRGALNGFVTEHRYVREGGAVSWGETRSAALRDAKDHVERVIVAVTDLTARRRTNATFRAVFEHSDDGYLILRRDGVDDANMAALRLFGVDRVDDLHMPLLGGAHAPDVQSSGVSSKESGAQILSSAWDGTTHRGEWDILRPDGVVAPAGITVVPIQVGEDDALLVVAHDLAQRKQFEAELVEARDEAESAARAKADFLATMSHEIRTPMNGVIGMIDLLAESPLSADQQRMITTTKDSAFALLAIINDVLDFSKIEAGKLDLEQVPVGVHELGDAVCEMLGTNASGVGLSLQSVVEPDVPEAVIGDPVRLRQILFNLVGNAIKFTPSGGVLVRSSILDTDDGQRLRLSVEDTGIGMTPEQVGRLFQPFTQAESSTTRRFGGTGLGLSIVSRLVQAMSGSVSIDSEPDRGSSFHVDIPLQPAEWNADLPDLSGLSVATVSDGSPEDLTLQRVLARAGAQVETVDVATIQQRLRRANSLPDVVYLGSALDPVDRVRVRGLASSSPSTHGVGFVGGVAAGTANEAPELPDTTMVTAAPLTRLGLSEAIAIAAGRKSPAVATVVMASDSVTREDAIACGQLLLVAEDNRTNQEVIRRQLLLLGYWGDIVADGRAALTALESSEYAALLTDCHMPVVDGFELTSQVRASEEGTDRHLPIIAITANALQGEASRCLAEGMDDYLTKPLDMARLTTALNRWVGPSLAAVEASPSTVVSTPDTVAEDRSNLTLDALPILDASILETTLRGDRATTRLLLADFVPNARDLVDGADIALGAGDLSELARIGHTLKSSARAVGALRLGEACDQLESDARSAPAEQLERDVPRLRRLFEDVERAVQKLLEAAATEVPQ